MCIGNPSNISTRLHPTPPPRLDDGLVGSCLGTLGSVFFTPGECLGGHFGSPGGVKLMKNGSWGSSGCTWGPPWQAKGPPHVTGPLFGSFSPPHWDPILEYFWLKLYIVFFFLRLCGEAMFCAHIFSGIVEKGMPSNM